MAEESSFEFINERSEGLESSDNENSTKSRNEQLRNVRPNKAPELASTSHPEFHQNTFSPEIPEDKNTNSITSQPVDDSYGAMGLFEWVKGTVGTKGTDILSKVAEQAKKSVDSVITTLDPQIYAGDSSKPNKFEIIVLSEKEIEISPIREAFMKTVGRNLDIRGIDVEIEVAKQVVGFDAATKIANAKIESFKQGKSTVERFVVVQNFIVEIQKDKWFDLDLVLLADMEKGLRLETYSQMIPIPSTIINVAKGDTPLDYKFMEDGLAVTVASLMASNLQVHPSEWQEELTLISRRKRILHAAIALANLYNNTLF